MIRVSLTVVEVDQLQASGSIDDINTSRKYFLAHCCTLSATTRAGEGAMEAVKTDHLKLFAGCNTIAFVVLQASASARPHSLSGFMESRVQR